MAKKDKKIRITPRREPPPPPPPPKREEPRERDTLGSQRMTIGRKKPNDYHRLAEEHENIKEQYQQFRRWVLIGGVGIIALGLIGGIFWWAGQEPTQPPAAYQRYGIPLDSFQVRQDLILANQTLDDILISHSVPLSLIPQLSEKARAFFNPERLIEGARMTVLTSLESGETQALIYEPNPYEYHLLDLRDSLKVQHIQREVSLKLESAGGIIDSVLWEAVLNKGLRHELIGRMEDALKWSVDLYHLNPGDRFKLVYQARYADGELVGIEQLQALYFQTRTKAVYAYYHPFLNQFVDDEGRPMKRTFLQAPVQYARISSPFNLNRYHPVLEKIKPHRGTDYAAPEGTPIQAVADGVISIARFAQNNGNYVKIRHDDTYETQYLHMSEFAPGIKPGVRVQQGEVIGFVGSTGLSSGPHVCFRFWKNGEQVDHRAENLASPAPAPAALEPEFLSRKDSLNRHLQATSY